jgi:NodT family efflux transporter outer membrane factor (OMF) lipoprotein
MRHPPRAARTCLAAVALLTGCAVGPDYHRPSAPVSADYKEQSGWKPSEPKDGIPRGAWWSVFEDPALDELERQVDVSNENIKAALAAYDQARALVREAQAQYFPTLSANAGKTRSQGAVGRLNSTTGTAATGGNGGVRLAPTFDTYSLGATVDWTIDVWGQIRRTVESNRANAQASAAALAAARLSAQGELATDYFALRAQDQLLRLLDDTVAALQRSLKITQSRYRYGVAARADVVSAETQLLSSQSQLINAGVQRATLEHAIAVLIGKPPAEFALARAAMRSDVPTVPAGVPSTLLERRPDVAEAERKMAAANAQIGVAIAAYFPTLTLSGSIDYTNNALVHLVSLPNRAWSVGAGLAEPLFEGGLRGAQVANARAAYAGSVASYRQTVLASLQQVEDQIATLRILEQQSVVEEQTVKAAREAETLTLNQYKAGTVPYSSVISAQTTRLGAEETALTVLSNRLQASVALIEALGGGWDAGELPARP